MNGFTLRSIAGAAWPPMPPAEISQLWTMFLELERTQWLDAEEMRAGQLAQIRSLLDHAFKHVPYYGDLYRRMSLAPEDIRTLDDFRRLPCLTRSVFQEQSARFQANLLPTGTLATTAMRTSGTSGVPIEVHQTNLVNLWWFAFHLRDLAWCGVDARGSMAVIRGLGFSEAAHQRAMEGYKQPHWNEQFPQLIENGPAYVMDVHQDPRRQLQWLLRVQPDYLLSYPPNLECLASLLKESGQRLGNLKTVLTIGETLTEEAPHDD